MPGVYTKVPFGLPEAHVPYQRRVEAVERGCQGAANSVDALLQVELDSGKKQWVCADAGRCSPRVLFTSMRFLGIVSMNILAL